MNCLEFKRLVLTDPYSRSSDFVAHSSDCRECHNYLGAVRKMDAELADSLQVDMPTDLVARLKLRHELSDQSDTSRPASYRRLAIAASVALAVFVAGIMASNQFGLKQQIDQDHHALLAAVVEHMHETPITPVWDAARANTTAKTLLASYDTNMHLKYLDNLQFTKICPMGQYRGLHASLETADGPVTFVYIKGESMGELLDAGYEGYVTRVKPVRGGNLIIMSRTNRGLQQADQELQAAMVWDI